jgi:hypothetical protein
MSVTKQNTRDRSMDLQDTFGDVGAKFVLLLNGKSRQHGDSKNSVHYHHTIELNFDSVYGKL